MWIFGAVITLLGVSVLHADASGFWACFGKSKDALVRNPTDCGSYYVCQGAEHHLIQCSRGLHFDQKRKLCNWPQLANCTVIEKPSTTPYANTTTEVTPTTTQSTTVNSTTTVEASTTTINTTTILTTTPEPTTLLPTPPTPVLGAFDEDSGTVINPMDGYNPQRVQCIHDGIYFLPHPIQCDKYFLCAHRELVLLNCGSNLTWNYRREQCQMSLFARCYYREVVVNATEAWTPTTTAAVPETSYFRTPPVPESTITVDTTEIPTTVFNGTTVDTVTIEILTHQPDAVEDVEVLPDCEDAKRSYYPHPTDCERYYICINGSPILTFCPQNLYWNANDEFCSLPAYSDCKPAEKLKH